MTNVVNSYQNNDITKFEKILKTNHSNIMDDSFLREHCKELFAKHPNPSACKIKAYGTIQKSFISKELTQM